MTDMQTTIITDFQKVCEFNKCFDFPQFDDLTNNKCLQLRLDLIEEELKELQEAYNNQDIIEEQDACADILYVAYGMAYTYKIDSDEYMKNYYFLKNNESTLFKKLNYDLYLDYNLDRSIYLNKLFDDFNTIKEFANYLDKKLTMDILHQLIYHVYEFQYISKYDSDRIFTIVHDSNMSKLCKNENEAIDSVNKYIEDYKNGNSPYDSPYYYKLDNDLYVIKNKSTGKALKSINYTKVQL